MIISIGDKTRECMKTLKIDSYPFTEKELKDNYRQLVKIYHPDINNSLDNNDHIKVINSAYEHLKNLAINTTVSEDEIQAQVNKYETDTDIFKLWEPCKHCKGVGKIKLFNSSICFHCTSWDFLHSFNTYKHLCRSCKGTGKFKQRSGRVVDCYKCSGTGIFGMKKCTFCNNTGYLKQPEEFKICPICKGIGKIELKPFNPVIPKGAVL